MPNPVTGRLSESHQRRLLANAQYADKLLSDIESILSANEAKAAFPKYRPDVSLPRRDSSAARSSVFATI